MASTQENAAVSEMVEGLLNGSRRSAGRLITVLERGGDAVQQVVQALFPHTGNAYIVGVTGPPGAGKSTLVDELIRVIRAENVSVAVVAVDPNSPFSGGAILGDRIRMMRHADDPGVFIRSMGARGHLGGLAGATWHSTLLLDALGMDVVLLETVGVGQSELEVASAADTTIVLVPPGAGDGVQAIKAGILEIADVFVVNKADHPHADKTVAELQELMRTAPNIPKWSAPIVRTVATQNIGVDDVWASVRRHRDYLGSSGELQVRRSAQLQAEILRLAEARLRADYLQPTLETVDFGTLIQGALRRELDPYEVVERVLRPGGDTRKKVAIGQ